MWNLEPKVETHYLKGKHIRERNIDRKDVCGIHLHYLQKFPLKNEKKDTSSKKRDNFPRKHSEIEHNSQKFIPQNTVFLGFILNRI